ncbi:MAG: hypothetical protein RMK61_01625 [Bacteroidota bacterium]|nr:hypothetical protein [Bacteroidota bacterium]
MADELRRFAGASLVGVGRRIGLLGAALGLGQAFFYLVDFPALYIASKALLPALALAMGMAALLWRLRWGFAYPYATALLGATAALAVLSALTSAFYFGQPLFWGLWAQVKLAPVAFYVLSLYLLRRFAVSLREIAWSVSAAGALTVLAGLLLKLFADPAWFASAADGRFVLYDPIRGHRYNLYLPLLMLALLYWAHQAYLSGKPRYILATASGLWVIAFVVQSRTALLGTLLGLGLGAWRYPAYRRLILFAVVGAWALFIGELVYFRPLELLSALSLRLETAARMWRELGEDSLRWLLGMGYLNPLWGRTLRDYYGEHFWTSDVGWLGIAFELGLVGVLLVGGFYVLLGRALYRLPEGTSAPLVRAFRDFFWVTVLLSPLVPNIPLHTGLYASLLAVAVYGSSAHAPPRSRRMGARHVSSRHPDQRFNPG